MIISVVATAPLNPGAGAGVHKHVSSRMTEVAVTGITCGTAGAHGSLQRPQAPGQAVHLQNLVQIVRHSPQAAIIERQIRIRSSRGIRTKSLLSGILPRGRRAMNPGEGQTRTIRSVCIGFRRRQRSRLSNQPGIFRVISAAVGFAL